MWELLESLGHSNTLLWLCLGDYNEILSQTEKAGGHPRPIRQMDRFHMAISHYGFLDLGYRGSPFTWSQNHPTDGRIRYYCMEIKVSRSIGPTPLHVHLGPFHDCC